LDISFDVADDVGKGTAANHDARLDNRAAACLYFGTGRNRSDAIQHLRLHVRVARISSFNT
jgi:hypothetical protein